MSAVAESIPSTLSYRSSYNPVPPQNLPISIFSQGFFLSLSLSFLFPFYLALFTWLLLPGSFYLALQNYTHLTLILPSPNLDKVFPTSMLCFTHSQIHSFTHSHFTINNSQSTSPFTHHPSPIIPHPSPTNKKDTAPTEPHPDITSHFLHIYRSYGANHKTRIIHLTVIFKLIAISTDLGDFYVKRSQRDSPLQIKR